MTNKEEGSLAYVEFLKSQVKFAKMMNTVVKLVISKEQIDDGFALINALEDSPRKVEALSTLQEINDSIDKE